MSKFYDRLKLIEFTKKQNISRKEFESAKKELSKEDFEARYKEDWVNGLRYLGPLGKDYIDDSEIVAYLLYQNLKLNRKMQKDLNIIKGIIIFAFVVSLLAGVAAVIGFVL